MQNIRSLASANFGVLAGNDYPGRGFIMGIDETDKFLVILYFLTSRSDPNRNRRLEQVGERTFTVVADPNKPSGNAALTIYDAMTSHEHFHIVGNGVQTESARLATPFYSPATSLATAMSKHGYEPDHPNYTPRITGLINNNQGANPLLELSIIGRSLVGIPDKANPTNCDRPIFPYYSVPAGCGYGMTTYLSGADPLPPWNGMPMLLPLEGDPATLLDTYWSVLPEAHRVAMAVKVISRADNTSMTHIRNRYPKIELAAPAAAA